MKAYQLIEWQKPAELREIAVPEPKAGEVLIKIGGAGACHSDLHLMEWPPGLIPFTLPFTLGHENAGWIEKLGPGVEGFAIGDPVIVYGAWGCGRCRNCRMGMENYCENVGTGGSTGAGLGHAGGMANYMLVPAARYLVPLKSLDPRDAAPLADAALTTYHAIKRSLGVLGAGSTAVVIGVGGLGQMAIQILKALCSAAVIAVDLSATKLAEAKRLGADEALIANADSVPRIRELTRGLGAELVLDVVGADATLTIAAQAARRLGHLTLVGLGGGTLAFNFFTVPQECSVAAPYWGSIPELMEVIALAEAGKIRAEAERFPLARAAEAYQRLREGKIKGRAVITPND